MIFSLTNVKPVRPLSSRFSEWCTPPEGDFKLNVDAGFSRAESAGCCEMVIRDHSGGVIIISAARRFL